MITRDPAAGLTTVTNASPQAFPKLRRRSNWLTFLALMATWLVMIPVAQAQSEQAGEEKAGEEKAGQAQAESSETPRLKAMLVTGGCCHDYDTQKVIITEGLTQRLGPIEWTIHQYDDKRETRATVYENPDWAKGYDLVVHNECFGNMQDADLIRNIIRGHESSGAAAVFVHCSMHSYRNSKAADDWRKFLGVTSTYHEKAKRSLAVIPTDEGRESKLVAVLGDKWDTPNGELYIIKQVWPGTTVLAKAYSTEEDSDQPVIWRREGDGVRVFATTLGHHNETIRSDEWQTVVAAGTRWALGRE